MCFFVCSHVWFLSRRYVAFFPYTMFTNMCNMLLRGQKNLEGVFVCEIAPLIHISYNRWSYWDCGKTCTINQVGQACWQSLVKLLYFRWQSDKILWQRKSCSFATFRCYSSPAWVKTSKLRRRQVSIMNIHINSCICISK